MLKELNIAIDKQQQVSIRTDDGEIIVGLPTRSIESGRVKIHSLNEIFSVPLKDINHVMRIIEFPSRQ
ncbi:hypothetical protein AMS62_03040 [Bacillus sp. FJAT-18019]|nr:hypothetical protein AMS62_03040 [Bacillus sp. FJAT-18019]